MTYNTPKVAKIALVWFDRAENARPHPLSTEYEEDGDYCHAMYEEAHKAWMAEFGIIDEV